jgi:O-antigen/teichoic acid export membrane protein
VTGPDSPGSLLKWLAQGFPRTLGEEWLSYGRLYFARLLGQVLGVVLTIASARVLQPEGRGELVALSVTAVLGAQALNLGLSSSLAVLFSRRPVRIGRYRRHLAYLAFAWAAVLTALGTVLAWIHPSSALAWWPLWAAWVPLLLLGLYQGAALVALQDARSLARIELTGRCCALVLGVSSLLVFGNRLGPFLAAVVTGDTLIAILGAVHLARVSPGRPASFRRAAAFFRSALRLGLRAYPPLVLFFLLVKSDILVLRLMRGAAETGVYSIASQIVDVALILPSTIGALVLASVVRSKLPATELLRVLRPAALAVGGLALAMLVLGHWAILWVFGSPFVGAYPALVLLLPGFVALALQGLLGQYFASRGFPVFVSVYWLVGLVVNVTMNILLVPRFGLLAAAASSSVTYGLVFGLMLRHFRAEYAVEKAR